MHLVTGTNSRSPHRRQEQPEFGPTHHCILRNVTQVEIQVRLPSRVDDETVRVVGGIAQRIAGCRKAVLTGRNGERIAGRGKEEREPAKKGNNERVTFHERAGRRE